MSNFKKLSHVIYLCTYHIVWTPKYQYRILEGLVKDLLSKDIQMLIEWKSCELIEMNIQIDHIHLIVSVPLKYRYHNLWGFWKVKPQSRSSKVILSWKRSHIGAIIFGQEDIVLTPLDLTKKKSRNTSNIKKSKNA